LIDWISIAARMNLSIVPARLMAAILLNTMLSVVGDIIHFSGLEGGLIGVG
jgi:hypothetical protein